MCGLHLSPDLTEITEPPPPEGADAVYFKRNVLIGISAVSVSSITRSGSTATVTTATAHGFQTGQYVTIAGATQTEYNGLFAVTVTSTTVFTYTVSGSPATPATGTITAAVDPVDVLSAEIFETGVGKLVTDECDNPFPIFTETPRIDLQSLGDYNLIVVPTSLDAASDLVNTSTAGHKFKVYKGNVFTVPSDGVYKAHFFWVKC